MNLILDNQSNNQTGGSIHQITSYFCFLLFVKDNRND